MRNIVLCCDGTSNEFCTDNTNGVKLYQMLKKHPDEQLYFYDPGVGTFASPGALLPVSKRVTRVLGLAIGLGLMTNVQEAYQYLMNHWRPGDEIYIFGFSRGAYTARAVAAMVHRCGLLEPGQEQLVPYASRVFRSVAKQDWSVSRDFNGTFGRPVKVRFLGLWDTVSSVGWAWDPESLPFTRNNADVETVRHAVAIDERRAFFRQNLWAEGGDVKQVWFAGVHCDVGGSYPPDRSGLSQITLEWMVAEADLAGLKIDQQKRRRVLSSPPPDHAAPASESLAGFCKVAEYYPKRVNKKVTALDRTTKWKTFHRMNRSRCRTIPEGSLIHESVFKRMEHVPSYRPTNLPAHYAIEQPRQTANDTTFARPP